MSTAASREPFETFPALAERSLIVFVRSHGVTQNLEQTGSQLRSWNGNLINLPVWQEPSRGILSYQWSSHPYSKGIGALLS